MGKPSGTEGDRDYLARLAHAELALRVGPHPFFVRVFFDQKIAEWVSLSRCNTNKDGTMPIFTPMGKMRSIT
jgi:hypothetical protein